ncbi:MAG: T9SS type A sorting domain-containing protein [Bacteroidota bacterium]
MTTELYGQCGTAAGDEVSYGSGSWIGYAYDGANNFASADYQGFFTETQNFDESFCGNNCDFAINGCDINTETFSVRFRMNETFVCGTYSITVGGDDGYRLSIDGGATYIIENYGVHPYETSTADVLLNGTYDMVLEFYENTGENRISFDIVGSGSAATAGSISGDQSLCGATSDPAELTSIETAEDCAGNIPSYQWQSSTDNISFSDIVGATGASYDPPAIATTTYFRRSVTLGATTLESNTVTVTNQTPIGDEVTAGSGSWIGYVYDGVSNFTTDYRGEIFETEIFDEDFGGAFGSFATSGCDVDRETFSVRFLMQRTFTCSQYTITVGADDGYRLSIDGGSTYLIDQFTNGGYRTSTIILSLDGTYDMVLDYFENGSGNRVSYSFVANATDDGGEIGTDQSVCSSGSVDPAALTSVRDASFCSAVGSISYQWQESPDGISFTDITGANASTYDPGLISSTTYYQRVASLGGISETSNVVTVSVTAAVGDQVTYGSGSWIGYVYDGADNYASADYLGEIFEAEEFDESFGGNDVTFATSGCDFNTTTFTVRFRMNQTYAAGDYTFRVGGDDGYRLSIDGGSTYLIDNYTAHGYVTTDATVTLSGNYDLVLEYFENGGGNRVSFEITSTVLPVELVSFNAVKEDAGTLLTWLTASELDNDYFQVERSTDGVAFEPIGKVNGNGTTAMAQQYQWMDETVLSGPVFYRLKQVDFDGDYEYSPVVFVEHPAFEGSTLYPNPSNGQVFLRLVQQIPQGSLAYQLLDLSGRVKEEATSAINGSQAAFDFQHIETGTYYLVIHAGSEVLRERIVIK